MKNKNAENAGAAQARTITEQVLEVVDRDGRETGFVGILGTSTRATFIEFAAELRSAAERLDLLSGELVRVREQRDALAFEFAAGVERADRLDEQVRLLEALARDVGGRLARATAVLMDLRKFAARWREIIAGGRSNELEEWARTFDTEAAAVLERSEPEKAPAAVTPPEVLP